MLQTYTSLPMELISCKSKILISCHETKSITLNPTILIQSLGFCTTKVITTKIMESFSACSSMGFYHLLGSYCSRWTFYKVGFKEIYQHVIKRTCISFVCRVMQPIYLRKLVLSFTSQSNKTDQAYYGGEIKQ